ncbi:solute carrier family 12 member 3, partial [Reticulomyxa filosa]
VAILLSSFIYLIMGVAAAGAVSPEGLLHNYLCMVDVAASPILVYIGIYAATFSSALSVQFCAPRVLMSVANDNVLPSLKIFGKTNSKGDPVASALVCFGISLIFVLVGDLNIVAPLITQVQSLLFAICVKSLLFLGTYGFISLACFIMSISHSPGWRPSFRYSNKYTAFVGFVLCLAMMFATSWIYALLSIGLGAELVYFFLIFKKKKNIYIQNTYTYIYVHIYNALNRQKANEAVLDLVDYRYHVKNYQPSFLVLCGNPEARLSLVKFTHTLRHGNGTIIYGDILCGNFQDKLAPLRNRAGHYLPKYMKIRAFYAKTIAPDLKSGAESLMQLTGLGNLKCNVL